MKKLTLAIVLIFNFQFSIFNCSAQQVERCGTVQAENLLLQARPDLQQRLLDYETKMKQYTQAKANTPAATPKKNTSSAGPLVVIPIVVHVVHHTQTENISDQQIQSQIVALNEDYRLHNADSMTPDQYFWQWTADTQIEFCLATVDPSGNATTGITRTYTDTVSFNSFFNNMKHAATGGVNNWDPKHYLNIWVCNIGQGNLGRSSNPAFLFDLPSDDGVIIRYNAFGYVGTVSPPYNNGRTTCHEVGHWFGLKHIWGDDDGGTHNGYCDGNECSGSDDVDDTPDACEANYGCKTFPWNAYGCTDSDWYGEMYMNYMDYGDDNCLVMFTFGQSNRMWGTIQNARYDIANSNGCGVPIDHTGLREMTQRSTTLFPNPNNGTFTIGGHGQLESVDIVNMMGQTVATFTNLELPHTLNLQGQLPCGVYYVKVGEFKKGLKLTVGN